LLFGESFSFLGFASEAALFAFGGTSDSSLAALLALDFHLPRIGLAPRSPSFPITDHLLFLIGDGDAPFELLGVLLLTLGLILGKIALNAVSVELHVNTEGKDVIFSQNIDVHADVLLGFSNQSHLLLSNLNNLLIAG
jgi:hypothetical protein